MQFDAIIIPGGGLKNNHQLPPWTQARLDRALSLSTGSEYFITLSGFTSHKPPQLDARGYPSYEATVSADYLARHRISRRRILRETISFDTIGNAFFARVIHTDLRKLRTLAVVTSDVHLPRTREIFDWVFHLRPDPGYVVRFFGAADHLPETLLARRRQVEHDHLVRTRRVRRGITSLRSFHHWLFTQHEAYAYGLTPKRLRGKILETY